MAIQPRINVDDLVQESDIDFRVSRRVYTDPEIFELEMERIFERSWVCIGHESEVPNGGDYKTTSIGKEPLIMSRDPEDGRIYVVFNRCRHRGTTVCEQEYGNATYFRCGYHGWVYNNKGELIGVPSPEEYGRGFNQAELGLMPVARVATYHGLVFASLSADGPSLEEQLGNARLALDFILGQGDLVVSTGHHKFGFDGNWKLQLENTVDGYHFPFVHRSQMGVWSRREPGGSLYPAGEEILATARTRDLGNGHNTLGQDPFDADYQIPAGGLNFNVGIFPNVDILALEQLLPTQIRIIRPIAFNRTEVTLFPLLKKNAPPAVNFDRLRRYEEFYGPSSFGATDDWEIFSRVQKGLQAKRVEWILFSRGLEKEEVDSRGIRTNRLGAGEASQRGVYRHWKRLMAE